MTIKGTVIRVGSIGLICSSMAFECSSCHNIQAVMQPQGIFTGICVYIHFIGCLDKSMPIRIKHILNTVYI